MSVFKDFPGLEKLEKNSRTFKDPQEPCKAEQRGVTKTDTEHEVYSIGTHCKYILSAQLLQTYGRTITVT